MEKHSFHCFIPMEIHEKILMNFMNLTIFWLLINKNSKSGFRPEGSSLPVLSLKTLPYNMKFYLIRERFERYKENIPLSLVPFTSKKTDFVTTGFFGFIQRIIGLLNK